MSDTPAADNKIKYLLFTFIPLIVFCLLFELVGYLAHLAGYNSLPEKTTYNRTLSGYYVCKNTPDYTFFTHKPEPGDKDIRSNERGFICDAPLKLEKPPGTIRIFVAGGSALLGAGQIKGAAVDYEQVHVYPGGLHTYERSIAGQLKRYLEEANPDFRYEVINAGMYTKVFHQSLMQYLESISLYAPDVIVNMDGFNEVFTSGDPFRSLERGMDKYLALLRRDEGGFWSRLYSYNLLRNTVKRFIKHAQKRRYEREAQKEKGAGQRVAGTGGKKKAPESDREQYMQFKPAFVRFSGRFLSAMRHYTAVLRGDGVKFVFALQPVIIRRGGNKELSPIEEGFARLMSAEKTPNHYAFMYFWDEYFSGEVRKAVEKAGFRYLDLGREIKSLDASFELYTDYCHLTAEGNRFIARKLGAQIIEQLPPPD